MDHRREVRAMVRWEIAEPTRLLGLLVSSGVGAANKPIRREMIEIRIKSTNA
jgi:hypothetical protein